MNIHTALHMKSVLTHAVRAVENGVTLKETREYLHLQLIDMLAQRLNSLSCKLEIDPCYDTCITLSDISTKYVFIVKCNAVITELVRWIADWRMLKMADKERYAPKVGDICEISHKKLAPDCWVEGKILAITKEWFIFEEEVSYTKFISQKEVPYGLAGYNFRKVQIGVK